MSLHSSPQFNCTADALSPTHANLAPRRSNWNWKWCQIRDWRRTFLAGNRTSGKSTGNFGSQNGWSRILVITLMPGRPRPWISTAFAKTPGCLFAFRNSSGRIMAGEFQPRETEVIRPSAIAIADNRKTRLTIKKTEPSLNLISQEDEKRTRDPWTHYRGGMSNTP